MTDAARHLRASAPRASATAIAATAAMAASLLLPGPRAQAQAKLDESGKAGELKIIEQQLDKSRTRKSALNEELAALSDEADKLSRRLVALARQIQAREASITAGETRIGDLDFEEKVLAARLVRRREAISELLVGLQRLERNPPPPLAANPKDAIAALRSAALFDTVLAKLKTQSDLIRHDLARLGDLRKSLKAERADLQHNLEKLRGNHAEISKLHARKLKLVGLTSQELAREGKRAAELAGQARSLKQLLAALAAAKLKREADQRRKEEIARRKALAERNKPRLAFSRTKGRLEFPVQGQRLRGFGEADGFKGHTKGLFIASRKQAQVIAPADARIEFAGTFRSYGKLLILDVGEGYHVLLAGLGHISVKTGQYIRSGEPVGLMGSSPASGTLIGDQLEDPRPILYVEFRKNGGAVDPKPWWIDSRKEARN